MRRCTHTFGVRVGVRTGGCGIQSPHRQCSFESFVCPLRVALGLGERLAPKALRVLQMSSTSSVAHAFNPKLLKVLHMSSRS